MRFVRIDQTEPGMVVARPIYGAYGVLLLGKGNPLNPRQILGLKQLGYPGVYIEDIHSKNIELEEVVDEGMRRSAIAIVKEMFEKGPQAKAFKNEQMYITANTIVSEIVDHVFDSNLSVLNIPLMKNFDDYTYQHSVDVTILCIMIGKGMGLAKSMIVDLGIAAFLHDMGKMFVPKSILNKPSKLSADEFEVMKRHSEYGYDFAREVLKQPDIISKTILHHHERFDGTGYPHQKKGKAIPLLSRIISVADVFDAIGAPRIYKKAQLATEGYEYILANSGKHFDPEVVDVFKRTIAPFPVGLTVRLSDGRPAVVIRNHPSFMMRPYVRAFDPDYPRGYEYIDMAHDIESLHITIVGTT